LRAVETTATITDHHMLIKHMEWYRALLYTCFLIVVLIELDMIRQAIQKVQKSMSNTLDNTLSTKGIETIVNDLADDESSEVGKLIQDANLDVEKIEKILKMFSPL